MILTAAGLDLVDKCVSYINDELDNVVNTSFGRHRDILYVDVLFCPKQTRRRSEKNQYFDSLFSKYTRSDFLYEFADEPRYISNVIVRLYLPADSKSPISKSPSKSI